MLIATLLLGLALVALLWWAIPWGSYPANLVIDPASKDFTAAQVAGSHNLRATLRWLSIAPWLIVLLVTILMGYWGPRWNFAAGSPSSLRTLIIVTTFTVVTTVIRLPFSIASLQVSRRSGLSTTSWGTWSFDLIKSLLINVLMVSAALGLLAWAARRWGQWWIPAAFGAAALAVLLSFLMPVLFEPVFNKFTPMTKGDLRTSLLDLAEHDGIRISDVLVADASRRTTALNAYVSGFGATRRIVVYDTLLKSAPPAEIRSVVAHELGHAKDNDVVVATIVGALAAALTVIALAMALGAKVGDPRYTLSIIAIVSVLSVIQQPLASAISREVEKRADVHALNLTQDPETFARMQKRLAVSNRADLATPWFISFFFATHPSTMERISFARYWARQQGLAVPPAMAAQ